MFGKMLNGQWVKGLAGVATFVAIVALAVPAAANTQSGTGLELSNLRITSGNDSSPTEYSVTVTTTPAGVSDNATGVDLYYAPEAPPSDSSYQPEEILSSCNLVSSSPKTWNCTFGVDWSVASAWYNSTTRDGMSAPDGPTVHDWYLANSPGQMEIFAEDTGTSGKGWSTMSDYVSLQEPPANYLPEVPYTVGLPIVLIAAAGGAVLVRRRARRLHS